jgi:hypothetical protein
VNLIPIPRIKSGGVHVGFAFALFSERARHGLVLVTFASTGIDFAYHRILLFLFGRVFRRSLLVVFHD